jgi:hypothetical protein
MNRVTMHVPESEAKEIRKLLGVEEPTKDYGKYLPNTLSGLAAVRDLDPLFAVLHHRLKATLKSNPYEAIRFLMLVYAVSLDPNDMQELINVVTANINARGVTTVSDKLLIAMMKEYDRMCDELEEEKTK